MESITCNIKNEKSFGVGDIIQYKSNPKLRYLVTAVSSINNKPTWIGISITGRMNGGTIEGSWNFDDWDIIDHFPIEEVFNYMRDCEDINGKKE